MLHHRDQRAEPSVVEEFALRVGEQSLEGARAVLAIGRAIRLEIVNPDVVPTVKIPTGFGEERLAVALAAPSLPVEDVVATSGGRGVEG